MKLTDSDDNTVVIPSHEFVVWWRHERRQRRRTRDHLHFERPRRNPARNVLAAKPRIVIFSVDSAWARVDSVGEVQSNDVDHGGRKQQFLSDSSKSKKFLT